MKKFKPLFSSIVASIALVGCTTAINHGNIVSISTRGIGFRVVPANESTQSPEVDFGFFSQNVQFIPTSTNNVAINAPKFANTFNDTQNGALNIGINETIATGDVATFNATNNASTPVIPK